MFRCNLAVILAEQNLKAIKVSADTGISRTTLTSLSNNNAQGIQFDTINTLCKYLDIGIEKLFSFIPVDFEIVNFEIPEDELNSCVMLTKIRIAVESRQSSNHYDLYATLSVIDNETLAIMKSNAKLTWLFSPEIQVGDEQYKQNFAKFNTVLKSLPRAFLSEFEYSLKDKLIEYLKEKNPLMNDVDLSKDIPILLKWGD